MTRRLLIALTASLSFAALAEGEATPPNARPKLTVMPFAALRLGVFVQ